ncbi:hypothetical protein CN188_09690 [Sinorhizobium meliloti]|uniref:hypothetical protein n=1 Tax=Rhizobium meliloti TaxID=382 RepID=UPI000FD8B0A8|nr:hypothetical protein [Sinorhizobium meliloti]RVI83931.1 hypothetical protein CN188_09690 [Sinorhizobium meliloti]
MTFDGKAFGQEIVSVVKSYLAKELAPVCARLDALEKRVEAIAAPVDLSDDVVALKAAVEAIVIPDLPEFPDLPDIPAIVADAVNEAVAAIPAPRDGKSVTIEDVAPLIAAEVEKCVSEIPRPKDGEPGRDGLDVKEMFRAEGGHLVAVMSDGTTRDLGVFVGKDGEPGKPGADGFGFDDMDVSYDGEKTITWRFTKGERTKEFAFDMPVVIDRGVFREGNAYKAGDGVTWAGSFWIAQKHTSAKPDAGEDWRLSVKRGRDGKDGVVKEKTLQPVRVGMPARSS